MAVWVLVSSTKINRSLASGAIWARKAAGLASSRSLATSVFFSGGGRGPEAPAPPSLDSPAPAKSSPHRRGPRSPWHHSGCAENIGSDLLSLFLCQLRHLAPAVCFR